MVTVVKIANFSCVKIALGGEGGRMGACRRPENASSKTETEETAGSPRNVHRNECRSAESVIPPRNQDGAFETLIKAAKAKGIKEVEMGNMARQRFDRYRILWVQNLKHRRIPILDVDLSVPLFVWTREP